MKSYDEDEAVKFIRAFLPDDIRPKYTDDEILLIIDTIWDWYESKGLTSLENVDSADEELDIDALTAYVKKEIKKDDEMVMDPADIPFIIKGELEYEESLEAFGD